MMETIGRYDRTDEKEPMRWATEFVLLALLIDSSEGSDIIGTANASESNLFFASTFGAGADAKYGLIPKSPEY